MYVRHYLLGAGHIVVAARTVCLWVVLLTTLISGLSVSNSRALRTPFRARSRKKFGSLRSPNLTDAIISRQSDVVWCDGFWGQKVTGQSSRTTESCWTSVPVSITSDLSTSFLRIWFFPRISNRSSWNYDTFTRLLSHVSTACYEQCIVIAEKIAKNIKRGAA